LIEAGFVIADWAASTVANKPPASLMRQFHEADLLAANVLFAADKPA
jgi:hypothetical protein